MNNNDRERAERIVDELYERGGGLATFDADGVLWREDCGNAFLLWQMENHRLRPEQYHRARQGWDDYQRGAMNDLEVAILCASVLEGLPEDQVEADATAFFDAHIFQSIIPATHRWAKRLEAAGVEVWVVSGSHRWLIAAGARALGISDQRLLTVCATVRDGVCTMEVPEPVTYDQGKAEAIRQRLGRQPDLAVGNTFADHHMMELARTAIAVEPDPELEALARERGWPVVRF